MSLSTVSEWLNENEYRAYPLTSDSPRYLIQGVDSFDLYGLIVDAMLVFPLVTDPVRITKILTDTNNMTVTVNSGDTNLTFVLNGYVGATYPAYVRDSNYNLLVFGHVANTFPNSSTYLLENVAFEPCVTNEIVPSTLGVSSITIGADVLTGDITLVDGTQVSLIPEVDTIDIEVGRNYGIPLLCGNFSTGPFDCGTIISSVNGVTPNKTGNPIFFVGDNHVVVYDDPDNHRIYLGYDFNSLDVPIQQLLNPPTIV